MNKNFQGHSKYMPPEENSASLVEQVRRLYEGVRPSVMAAPVLAFLLAAEMSRVVGAKAAFGWMAGLWVVHGARAALIGILRRTEIDQDNAFRWLRYHRILALAAAASWGVTGWLLFTPHDIPHQALLAFVLGGVMISALVANALDPISAGGFVYLTFLPFLLSLFAEGGRISLIMGLMILLFIALMSLNVRLIYRNFRDNIEARMAAVGNESLLWEALQRTNSYSEATPLAVIELDMSGRVVRWNAAAERIFGYSAAEVMGKSALMLMPEDAYANASRRWDEVIAQDVTPVSENIHKDGRIVFCEWHNTVLRDHDGITIGLVALALDVTSRMQVEQDLRIAAIAFESQEGMAVTDPDGYILRVNKGFSLITGYSAEEVVGRPLAMFKADEQDEEFGRKIWGAVVRDKFWSGDLRSKRKDGSVYPERLSITAVSDERGRVTHYVAAFADITAQKEAETAVHNLAYFDTLTNLPNRRMLIDRLGQAFAAAARSGRHGALLFIDLDHFKKINDTRGHAIGDILLREAAARLLSCVRTEDMVARLGGDEFVVLLMDMDEEIEQVAAGTRTVGEKILDVLNQPYDIDGSEYHCSASIGISLFLGETESVEELLMHADTAMYQAKAAGRNTVRFFDPAMQAEMTARLLLEKDLRVALALRQFQLFYQPQVDIARRVIGAEVLLRWEHPERGMVSPAQFIPLAEETGLILPIGHWVLETACEQLKRWEEDPRTRNLQLAVNVSARQFGQPDFVQQVQQVLQRTGADPARLKLELTESLVLHDVTDTITKMNALLSGGIRFSMDDFGTGHSSLTYLKKLPLYQLKIDQSFVRDIARDPDDATIVRTIIAMGRSLGLDVIAEGVETEEQRDFLESCGCWVYQGYLFGRPTVLAEFESCLKDFQETE
jgi:diguanylate cyclase (GGDEF)-like protein/PAS domain S-box-containing protein